MFSMQKINQKIQQMCTLLIRPPRAKYYLKEGVRKYSDGTKATSGKIFGLAYTYNQTIKHEITLIYLHCNSSSQLEGRYLESYLNSHNIALFLFDFEGCGNSDGNYITLGVKQAEQIFKIVEYIRKLNNNRIILWGRSMGASAVIRYLEIYGSENIVCAIVDSPFNSLKEVVFKFMKYIPNFILQPMFNYACKENEEKIGINLEKFKLEQNIGQIDCPVLFIASPKDQIVPFQHSKFLYDLIKDPSKRFLEIDQRHNQERTHELNLQCINFILKQLESSMTSSQMLRRKSIKYEKVVYRI